MKKDILLGQLKVDEGKINSAFFDNFTDMTTENLIGAIDTAQEHYNILQVDFLNKMASNLKIRINLEMVDFAPWFLLKFLGERW